MDIKNLTNQKDTQLKVIGTYLSERIETDKLLENKIIESNGTMEDCFEYIKSQAKEQAKNGVAMIEDSQVFNWAVHYFLEDIKTAKKPVKKVQEIDNEETEEETDIEESKETNIEEAEETNIEETESPAPQTKMKDLFDLL